MFLIEHVMSTNVWLLNLGYLFIFHMHILFHVLVGINSRYSFVGTYIFWLSIMLCVLICGYLLFFHINIFLVLNSPQYETLLRVLICRHVFVLYKMNVVGT